MVLVTSEWKDLDERHIHRSSRPRSRPEPSRWAILALLGVAQLMVVLDATVVNVALPSAQTALHFTAENRQWVITAYALSFGSLLLLGGKLGDLFGRKWTLVAGLTGFAVASAMGGLAQSFGMLVVARALQGVFGALLAPSALGLLTVTFQGSTDRAKAFGIFSAIAAGGASVGLLLGGVLTQSLSWRWSLYVNLAIAIPAVIAALRLIRGEHHVDRPRLDLPGVTAGSLGLFSLVYGFSNAETHSWSDPDHDHRPGRQRRPADRVRLPGASGRASTATAAHRSGSLAGRRVRDDRAGRLGRVRGIPVPHLLPAAEPRLLAAEDRPGVPAHDGDDRPHRDHGADPDPAPHRRQADRHHRYDAGDHGDAAVHPT